MNSKKIKLTLFGLVIFFILNFISGVDFGAFERDYFKAHSLGMDHLHSSGNIFQLIQTIPNSASGVLPLWFYGITKSIYLRKIISLIIVFLITYVIASKTKLDNFGRYFIYSLLISPMIISSATWVLPEIFALLMVVIYFSLSQIHWLILFIVGFCIPLSRQTFIIFPPLSLISRSAYDMKTIIQYGLPPTLGLALVYLIWGGLVPPRLMKVHYTPSVLAPIYALLIISLYTFYYHCKYFISNRFDLRKFLLSSIISGVIIAISFLCQPVLGGGYIFSRLQEASTIGFCIITYVLLTSLLYSARKKAVFIFLIMSLSFITTNYMFLKYIDIYMFCFLATGLTIYNSETTDILYEDYAKSTLIFELISYLVSSLYYYQIVEKMIAL